MRRILWAANAPLTVCVKGQASGGVVASKSFADILALVRVGSFHEQFCDFAGECLSFVGRVIDLYEEVNELGNRVTTFMF